MPIIAPSLLAADFLHLADECQMINNSQAEWLHLDVMDGRFVPNISFGISIIEQINGITQKELDVHLMIEEPEKYAPAFSKAGANTLTVHLEACKHLHRNIQQIKDLGMKAGVALNPHSPIDLLKDVLSEVDLVLIMSVNPGFGGQHFIPYSLQKIQELNKLKQQNNYHFLIEVDGGVTLENAKSLIDAGTDVLVAGSSVFKSANPLETIQLFKQIR
jgi:ribulose-phosphate 3-epimerase